MRIALLVFVMLLMSSCSSNTNNWPRGMTPFFAECKEKVEHIQIRHMLKESSHLVTEVGNFMTGANQR